MALLTNKNRKVPKLDNEDIEEKQKKYNKIKISAPTTFTTQKEISKQLANPIQVNSKTKQDQILNNRKKKIKMVKPYVVTGLGIDILRPKVLEAISVGKVTNQIEDGQFGINDPRGGSIEDDILCSTCYEPNISCVGHSQYISLPDGHYFVPPIFMNTVLKILKCVCRNCSGLLITETYMKTTSRGNILEYKGIERLTKIAEECVQDNKSIKCTRHTSTKGFNALKKGNNKQLVSNCIVNDKYKHNEGVIQCNKNIKGQSSHRTMHDQEEQTSELTMSTLREILENISDEDKILMGFPANFVLSDFITNKIPCIPHCARPQNHNDGEVMVDQITFYLNEIVKKIYVDYPKASGKEDEQKAIIKNITWTIYSHLVDNGDETLKRNGDINVISVKERITGKKGVLRGKSMGKRVDFVERSVLNPDSTLKFGEIGVPEITRSELTIPENVTQYNINSLQKLYENNEIKRITFGPERHHEEGNRVFVNEYVRQKVTRLAVGDKVERYARDGDVCLFGRQPTLHKEGFQGNRQIYTPQLTNKVHMCSVVSYNADFDGDEGTVHVIQTTGGQTEARYLANAESCIADGQKSKTMAGLTYNALSSAYIMTQTGMEKKIFNLPGNEPRFNDTKKQINLTEGKEDITVEEWKYIKEEMTRDEILLTEDEIIEATNILTHREHFDSINARFEKNKINPLSGRALFSYLLPKDFYYNGSTIIKKFNVVEFMNNKPTEQMLNEKNVKFEEVKNSESRYKKTTTYELDFTVRVRDGILISGTLKKAHVGATHNSMIHYLWKNYGKVRTAAFLTDGTFLTDWFIHNYGFTIGYLDCIPPDPEAVKNTVDEEMHNAELSIASLRKAEDDISKVEKDYREQQVRDFVDNAGFIGKRISSEQLPYTNPLNIMAESGAKGNANNTAQMLGLVGQQFIRRERPKPTLLNNTRCSPWFAPNSRKLEARGLIKESFMKGISPEGMFFHMSASRIGLIGTAINTADTGALHRRVSKAMESTCVAYDGSVRNSTNAIFQLACLDGFEAGLMISSTHKGMGNIFSFIDLDDTVKMINYNLKQRINELQDEKEKMIN